MAVSIMCNETKATITNLEWSCDDALLKGILVNFNLDIIESYTPWPDYTLAEMACKALGGKIVEATDPPEYVEGRIY